MKYHPSRLFLICMVPMLLFSVAGALVWKKYNSLPMGVRSEANLFEILKYEEPQDYEMPTAEEMARVRPVVEAMIADLTKEFPNLAAPSHPVADHENAFLQLHLLGGSDHAEPKLSSEFMEMLDDDAPMDPEAAGRCLEKHAEFVLRIEEVSLMENCSSSNLPDDYIGFISARTPVYGAKILLLKARLAAEAGDEDEVLRLVVATTNLSSHYREIENPTLLGETITVLIDLSVRDISFKYLLPALGKEADLHRWKNTLEPREYSSASFARILRGEWYTSARYMLYPVILDSSNSDAPGDAKALARAYAANFSARVKSLSTNRVADLTIYDNKASHEYSKNLSEESREFAEIFMIGSQAWAKGYARAALKVAQYDAAMELLIHERKGGSIGAEAMERVVPNPISGEAFEYDAVSRTLTAPPVSEGQEAEAVILPLCS